MKEMEKLMTRFTLLSCLICGLLALPASADYLNDFQSDTPGSFPDEGVYPGFGAGNPSPPNVTRIIAVDQTAVGTDPFDAPGRPADPFGGAGNQSVLLDDQDGVNSLNYKLNAVNGSLVNTDTGTFSVDLFRTTIGPDNPYFLIKLQDTITGLDLLVFEVLTDGAINAGPVNSNPIPTSNNIPLDVPHRITIDLDGGTQTWSGTITNLNTLVSEPVTQLIGGGTTFDFGAGAGVGDIQFFGSQPGSVGPRLFLDNISLTSGSSGTPGDFDGDGGVDGADFLLWQRDTGIGNLADWENNFGASAGVAASSSALAVVPEPASLAIASLGMILALGTRRRRG